MVTVLILVQLLLILCARFGEASGRSSGGQNNCPCLEDVPPLTKEDESIAESLGINNTDYGLGKRGEMNIWFTIIICKVHNIL